MKASLDFKNVLKGHLDGLAARDALFAESYADNDKNLDDCVTYVLNEVKKSGQNGFTDREVFSLAVHYYDEPGVDPGKPVTCHVVGEGFRDKKTGSRAKKAKPKEAVKAAEPEPYVTGGAKSLF